MSGGPTSAVVAIPARLASSRLPRKVLADIAGHPMIWHVYQRCQAARLPKETFVVTDSEEVASVVRGWGGRALMSDPDCPSGTARIASVIDRIDADVIVNAQGDEPLIPATLIDLLVEALTATEADVATAVFKIRTLEALAAPSLVKAVRAHDGRALYFSRSPVPYVRDVPNEEWLDHATFWGHIGIYAYRRRVLDEFDRLPVGRLELIEKLEQLRFLEAGLTITTVEVDYRPLAVDEGRTSTTRSRSTAASFTSAARPTTRPAAIWRSRDGRVASVPSTERPRSRVSTSSAPRSCRIAPTRSPSSSTRSTRCMV